MVLCWNARSWEAIMAQKLATTFTLLLFLLAAILALTINESSHVGLDELIYLPAISRITSSLFICKCGVVSGCAKGQISFRYLSK